MNRHPAAKQHEASHVIDDGCTAIVRRMRKMLDAVYVIEAQAQLDALKDAVQKLHDVATVAHDKAIREMKN
ncbi:hypothetical protein [Paraburkholderia sp.]|uniref:hypothetical protein n=1 Tax=Paraburkholderia sp. TaxID=1926495 RepID=UPI003C79A4FC